ncbi:MAG: hypothetical protein KIT11_10195 [Fimbriimonadaceae bacterium]|nr:hypothetical protein [Fimbriimonadaceae bacterium]QYK55692.1 MAG: hypothetical protein KF733_11865 [Fimbriimonadaceae bacterium]
MSVILLATGGAMVAGSLLTLSQMHDETAYKAVERTQADLLAEAGVSYLYDAVRNQMQKNGTYPGNISSVPLVAQTSNGPRQVGKFSGKVVKTTVVNTNVYGADGALIGTKTYYTFLLQGVGTTASGTQSTVRVNFEAEATAPVSGADGNQPTLTFEPGALQAAGEIRFVTDYGFKTTQNGSQPDASIVANGGVRWLPETQEKQTFTQPNLIEVNGRIMVPGDGLYQDVFDQTVGPSGLGNPNDLRNYMTIPNGGGTLAPGEVSKLSEPRTFMADDMGVNVLAAFRRFTQREAGQQASVPGGETKTVNWTAPLYISSAVTLQAGEKIVLKPKSATTPALNVVFIDGDLYNAGVIENEGVTLVVAGRYQEVLTGSYYIKPAFTPAQTKTRLQQSALVVGEKAADAAQLNPQPPAMCGLILALRGGVNLGASSQALRGAVVANGDSGLGQVSVTSKVAQKFTVTYEPDALAARLLPPGSDLNGTGVYTFTPSPMVDWSKSKNYR